MAGNTISIKEKEIGDLKTKNENLLNGYKVCCFKKSGLIMVKKLSSSANNLSDPQVSVDSLLRIRLIICFMGL